MIAGPDEKVTTPFGVDDNRGVTETMCTRA